MNWYRALLERPQWACSLIFVVGLVLRLLHLWQMSASPLFAWPAVDAATYAEQAAQLADGNWLGRGQGPFWQPPLYPYFLGLVKFVFPESFFYAARCLQALLGSLSCLLLYAIGRRLFGSGIGLAGSLIAAFYGPLIYFDIRLLPVGLATFLVLGGLLLLLRALDRPSSGAFAAAGLALGLASIAVATLLPLLPVLAIWLVYWQHRQGWLSLRRAGIWIGSFALGALLAIAPVAVRNYYIGGDAVLISYNGGVNFYIGNNTRSQQTLALRPGWEWEELMALPLRQGIEGPAAKSHFFYRRAVADISTSPLAYIGLLGRKMGQFWHGDELARNQEIYYWRKYSDVLAASLWKWGLAFPFGLLSPLALVGLVAYSRRGASLPVVVVLAYCLAVVAFFVTARYRLPIVPLLILFAVYGAHWLSQKWRQARWQVVVPGLGFGILVIGANWGLVPMDMRGNAATHNDIGNAYLRQGLPQKAHFKFQRAVQLDSTYWQAWFDLASLRAMDGDLRGALPIFRRVLQHHPERVDVWSNTAGAYLGLGDYGQALEALEQVVRLAPERVDSYVELVRLYMLDQQDDKAGQWHRRGLEKFPDEPRLRSLGAALDEW
ncbi:MAG: tetratricopeptide repeat protein [Candidatus Latescibacteria bacterium]|nr:tetratricopeptide repeat protein [Candidatus Latescibacterota bacterium]